MYKWITLPLLLLSWAGGMAQTQPTIQDCLGAISVCQQIYFEDQSPVGDGNINNEINSGNSCTAGEINSIWYTFTVDQSGDFGFVITPNDPDDDYDWSLFDITNAECGDIFTNPSLSVSCNAAGGLGCHGPTGATGDTNYDQQGGGCNNLPPTINGGFSPFNELIPVTAGNTYVLMVSIWTGSVNGYTIEFGLGAGVGIIDETEPEVESILVPDECNDITIELAFNELIQCGSLDASNFQLSGPGGPYTLSLSSDACDIGGQFEKEFVLTIDPPIGVLGDFTLDFLFDGLTDAVDLCDNATAPFSFDFTIDEALLIDVNIGADTTFLCVGETLEIDVTNPAATYLWQDGATDSTYTISASGSYSVTVTNACGVLSDTIDVTYLFEPPVVDLGSGLILCEGETLTLDASNDFAEYLWSDGSTGPTLTVDSEGLYIVEVTNACGTTVDEVFVDLIPDATLDFGTDLILCAGDSLLLDATNENAGYVWQDGSTNPTFLVTKDGLYAVTLTTPCESLTEEIAVSFIQEMPIELGADTILCPGDTLVLDVTQPGSLYQWQDATTNPVKRITSSGLYSVTVTTPCKIFEDDIDVTFIPPIDFDLGPDTFFCASQILLDASTAGFASYSWQDGNPSPFYFVNAPGTYSVSVYNQCEEIVDEIEVKECEVCEVYFPNVFSPNFDGFNDTFGPMSDCPLLDFQMIIFDRWGNLLYETTDPSAGWDGTFRNQRVNAGAYVWWMQFTVIENNNPRTELAEGSITVVK